MDCGESRNRLVESALRDGHCPTLNSTQHKNGNQFVLRVHTPWKSFMELEWYNHTCNKSNIVKSGFITTLFLSFCIYIYISKVKLIIKLI